MEKKEAARVERQAHTLAYFVERQRKQLEAVKAQHVQKSAGSSLH